MTNVEEITRIMEAGRDAGRAQEPMRFSTQEERNAWYEDCLLYTSPSPRD